jgi:two-component system chemotaxis sensor kinase CheA
MSETAQSYSQVCLTEQIDEISTRLILNGVASINPEDFSSFGRLAAEAELTQAANFADQIAAGIPSAASDADLTRLVSSGLVELRRLLNITHSESNPAEAAPHTDSEVADRTNSRPAQSASLAADEDLIREFITESTDHLVSIEKELLILEKDNSATETLNAIFRGFHTIKGLAGFLEFSEVQSLTHEVETLLDRARTSQLTVGPFVIDVVLESTDVVRHELATISKKLAGEPFPATMVNDALLEKIRRAASGAEDSDGTSTSRRIAGQAEPVSQPSSTSDEPAAVEVVAATAGTAAPPPQAERRTGDASSIRIDTAKLDLLMDMVGEMVIAQTLIQHSPALGQVHDPTVQRNLTQLSRITSDVQRITTGMRMVPIGLQFQKTARLIRDLARRAGKQIVFESSGEETEIDKSIAEQLSDPLLHMVRNSIDHGIEPSQERTAKGKDPTARIRIAAYHQSGQIVVAVSDDGRGLDREKILAKALQNGLIQPGAQLTDNEAFLLIFEAGFSTAEKITDISGRGVGMDVVRRHVQKMRGRIDIQSKPGEGTTFFIRLPLTLAIIEGLVVMVGQQRYIVPIFSVKEMFRPTEDMLSTVQGTAEMALVRGGLMPIVRLHRRFTIEPRTTSLTEGTLLVTESEGRAFCLFVDDLIGKQEVVIKSLGRRFKDVAGVAGCAILGDGRVGLILDIDGIYKGRS